MMNIIIGILLAGFLAVSVIVVLLFYCVGKRRDWERDDAMQEEAIRLMRKRMESDS